VRLAPLLALALAAPGIAVGIDPAAGSEGAGYWSAPVALGACPSSGAPRVVFPSDSPDHGTGPGAVVWEASETCPGGQGARVAAIGSGAAPGRVTVPRTRAGRTLAPRGPLAVAGAPAGEIAIAGASPQRPERGLLVEGPAGGPFVALYSVRFPAAPVALTTAYLGDVALATAQASARGADGLRVRLQRHYARAFGTGLAAGDGARAPVDALTVALDYRSDALAVWTQAGAIYARELPASGGPQPVQRLARAGADVRIAALLSDDDRAIVAWSEQLGAQTRVYLDRSDTGVRFGAPALLEEHYEDPESLPPPTGSPSLVRLSSESVMMAWAGAARGRWVVRTAAIDRAGAPAVATIAAPGRDALLEDLAPGPDGDAIVLWSEPQRAPSGRPEPDRRAIFAARGINAYPGRPIFGLPEQVAAPGPNGQASVAVDPDSDRALAVWRGAGGAVEYALRNVSPGR
jgi:hypothetical protein